MRRGLFIAGMLFCVSVLCVHADRMEEIRKNRAETLKELDEADKNLKKNMQDIESVMYELNSITADIQAQKKLMDEINHQITLLTNQQRAVKDTIALLEKDLKVKQDSYAEAVRHMSYRRSSYDDLMFVFSASSLGESYRRARYLREYSNWRKEQAEEIVAQKAQLEELQAKLDASIAEQKVVLREKEAEAEVLKRQERIQRELMAGLKKQEKQLKKEIARMNKEAKDLQRELDKLIAEEERKLAERAKKEEEKEGKTPSKEESKGYKMPKADVALAGSFKKNQGKLPVPISDKYKIVGHFGKQRYSGQEVNNAGIKLETVAGAKAKAVFDGVVAYALVEKETGGVVVIRHGNYYTLYSPLLEFYVKEGDKVKTGQVIGKVYTDSKNHTVLHFLMRESNKQLNPEEWLNLK